MESIRLHFSRSAGRNNHEALYRLLQITEAEFLSSSTPRGDSTPAQTDGTLLSESEQATRAADCTL
ncbi:hypothetical protein PSP6_690096 [Paraburkholderia tropica]|nr:hypothetical protein PSP6_690096 [Paraburkholderia tropica]